MAFTPPSISQMADAYLQSVEQRVQFLREEVERKQQELKALELYRAGCIDTIMNSETIGHL